VSSACPQRHVHRVHRRHLPHRVQMRKSSDAPDSTAVGSLWRRRERLCQTRLPVLHRCTLAVRDSDAPPGSARVTLGLLRVRSSPVSHLLRCPRSTQVTDLELASLSRSRGGSSWALASSASWPSTHLVPLAVRIKPDNCCSASPPRPARCFLFASRGSLIHTTEITSSVAFTPTLMWPLIRHFTTVWRLPPLLSPYVERAR
jgi:hypothetical protein